MPIDTFKPRGQIAADKPGKGGSGVQTVPLIGVVRDNVDPTRSGRIRVSLVQPNSSSKPEDSTNWITVSYLSSFFGKVQATANSDGYGTYKSNSSSYGQWQAPPDIGTQVICIFVNGDKNYGYYIGAIPEAESLQMVPAIGSSDNILTNEGEANSYGGATRLPVTNMNTNDKKKSDSAEFLNTARPVHSYTAAIMNQQGIIRDPIRGPISSSASRETVSRVGWGVSTPGRPIYTGGYDDTTLPASLQQDNPQGLQVVARRGGHSIVMDDGDIIGRDQLIRIRTALGHQILMSDDGQTLMILHSNGQSYIELGKEGTIDMYSTNSVNIRTQGDLNLHADRDVNIHAMENLNIQAKQIHTNSEDDTMMRSGGDFKTSATGDITGLAAGAIAFAAGGDASLAASGQAYFNGTKVNLNSGKSSTTPEAVDNIPLNAQTDTLHDEEKGFLAAPGKLLTIASRAPAHAPWANAGQGVDVKTSLNASDNLPAAPTPAATAASSAGAATGATPPAVATVASAPTNAPNISTALDKGTTNAMLGATATAAATGPLAAATKQGAAVVETATGKVGAIGSFALTPSSLASAGVLKPGADTLVNGLVTNGVDLTTAMPSSLFTGAPGAKDLTNLTQNITAQTNTVITNMQKSQTALGAAGVLTGAESPATVAGLVQSATTNGVEATTDAVKQVSGVAGAALGNITGALQSIGSGIAAAGLATSLGGLGGISNALTAMGKIPSLAGLIDQAKGIAGSAFDAIKNSFKPLKPNVPQNLTQIAKDNASTAAGLSDQTGQLSTTVSSDASSIFGSTGISANFTTLTGSLAGATGALTSLTTIAGSVNGAVGSINNSVGGITGSIAAVSTLASKATNIVNAATSSYGSVTTTIGGVTGVSSTLATVTLSSVTSNPLNPTSSGVQTAVNSVSAIAGAGATIASGGIGGLSTAASIVQQGSAASTSSTIASGLSNLPGGISAVSSVFNNAKNAVNAIPGVGQLTGAINAATASVMGGLNLSPISLPNSLNSLTSLASSGLSVGAAADLQSAIAALSSGPSGIKLPVIGFNTTDRTSITSQITNVLGDPGIPMPNLVGGIPSSAVNDAQSLVDQGNKLYDVIDQLDAYNKKAEAARKAYESARQTLPAGDPQLAVLLAQWNSVINDPTYLALLQEGDETAAAVSDQTSNTASAPTGLPNPPSTINTGIPLSTAGLKSTVQGIVSTITGAGTSLINLAQTTPVTVSTTPITQTATAIKALQLSTANNIASLNNSLDGITGPTNNA